MEKKELKSGDKVRIISIPVIDNNPYWQAKINTPLNKVGHISNIAKNGNRNIVVSFADFNYNYYNAENITQTERGL
jgi:hypothetical protein